MSQNPRPLHGTARAMLTDRVGPLRMLGAVWPILRVVAVDPKRFFGAIGSEARLRIGNALAFFAISLLLYVAIQFLFEQFLIQFAGYEPQYSLSYYATPFAEQGMPLAWTLGLATAALHTILASLFMVAYWTVSIWTFAHSFFHFGRIASLKSLFVAGLYAAGSIILALSFMSLPAAYFDTQDTAPGGLANLAQAGALQSKYEVVFAYLYLRSISLTSDLRLHWGLVFCFLLFSCIALARNL